MTVIPTINDSPDFTHESQFTSAAVLAVTGTATTTPAVVGTFYTGGYESLLIRASNLASATGFVFTFKWFAEQALTTLVGQLGYRTTTTIPIRDQTPNRGPWCQVTATSNNVSPKAYTLVVVPRTGTPPGGGGFDDGLIHGGSGASIGAGATLTVNALAVTTGAAVLTVVTGATTWRAELVGLDELSAAIGSFAGMSGTGGQAQSSLVAMPPYWTQLNLINTDAAPHVFDYAVEMQL